jgi:hypothetical protein
MAYEALQILESPRVRRPERTRTGVHLCTGDSRNSSEARSPLRRLRSPSSHLKRGAEFSTGEDPWVGTHTCFRDPGVYWSVSQIDKMGNFRKQGKYVTARELKPDLARRSDSKRSRLNVESVLQRVFVATPGIAGAPRDR